ncbi:HD-GYP domain-containing protein [Inhella gelatinilytica]|uniref:Phosphohydrolase n=1 Tax=Inhella gelatinilytica TaxID=2795030 RepID=A0A931N9J6_9BURK|nr:HD domain-containing phosphohydrolase [Inhella gelatinilytica]MBH9551433.1 phosphohydrolase [Inhella gelatinilytica]
MQLLKLVASQIKVGQPLPFNVRDEHGHLLLAAAQVIGNERQLEALLARGIHADVQEIKQLAAGRKVEPQRPTLFARWGRCYWALDALAREPLSADEFQQQVTELGDAVCAAVTQAPDVAIFLMLRQESHHLRMYGLTHSIYCAALTALLSARMQWTPERQRSVMMAALTMNLACLELQGRFAVYGRLTQEQRDELRLHPDAAVERLKRAGVTDEVWLRAVAEHHEHVDGKGYPRGLVEVSEDAQLVRLVDVFLAKISRRESRPALDLREAERQAYGEYPNSPLVAALIRELGPLPPGEVVVLANGERGVVVRRGPNPQAPLVATLTDKRGMPVQASAKRDTAQPEFAVKALEPDRVLVARLPPERVYGLIE